LKIVNLCFLLQSGVPIFGTAEAAGNLRFSTASGAARRPPAGVICRCPKFDKHSHTLRTERQRMEDLLREYLPILIFLGIAVGVSALMVGASYIVAQQRPDSDKLSAYECGFDPFDDARGKFDVRFYLVAILFIIFDLEVAFLFPWAITLGEIGVYGFWSMVVFLGVLTIGFIYEWKKGALEWE
jgi:NADH-quinone oxidoreductase subunit A